MTTTQKHTDFSFEVLPPLRGKGLTSVYNTIDRLMPYNPVCVNITTMVLIKNLACAIVRVL